jgi:hypothetical protein
VVKLFVVLIELDVKLVSESVKMMIHLEVKMEGQLEMKMVKIMWIWRKEE